MNGITDLFHSENEYYDNQRVTGFVQGTVVENNNADPDSNTLFPSVYQLFLI